MKKNFNSIFLITSICMLLTSCDQPQHNQIQNLNKQKSDYSPNSPEYYRVRGYQVFDQFKLAIKCPAKLNKVTTNKREWQYAGFDGVNKSKGTYYEITSFGIPNYFNESEKEQNNLEQSVLSSFVSKGAQLVDYSISGRIYKAAIATYRDHNKNGKAIILIHKGRAFGFNIMTDYDLESVFREYIESVTFYDDVIENYLIEELKEEIIKPKDITQSKRTLRYLWFANGGLLGFFNDGTMSSCPRCDLYKDAIDRLYTTEPHSTFTIQPDGSLLINKERIEYPSEEELKEYRSSGWAMIDYEWMVEIEGIDLSSGNQSTKVTTQSEVWFINTQFGLAFETPKALVRNTFDQPIGTEELIKDIHSYTFRDEEIVINYMIYELTTDYYNTKEGLRGAVNNLVNVVNGRNLNLNYYEIDNGYNNNHCEGTFILNNIEMKIYGYSLYKTPNRAFLLIGSGQNTQTVNNKLTRVFSSIVL